MIPNEIQMLADRLRKMELPLGASGHDGRIDSAQQEREVLLRLLHARGNLAIRSPNIDRGNNRAWYDLEVDETYLCDIKISKCDSAADNTNAKIPIYYFLTGKQLPDNASFVDRRLFPVMREQENPSETRDFYYLIINKTEPADVFVATLKTLRDCRPNGNNLPFQACWDKCREPADRTWEQAKDFLLGMWAKSVVAAIKKYSEMEKHYPAYFHDE